MWVILMRLLGRTSTPSLNHFPVTLSSDTSHLNNAWSVALTVRSAMSCSTSSCFSKCTIWKAQENIMDLMRGDLRRQKQQNKKIIGEYILVVPSTSSSPLVCPPFVQAWYIPMSSSVASWMISVCFFPSFLKRYFESLSFWSSISSKNLWQEKDWACLKHFCATWTQKEQKYQETHQNIHIKNATEQLKKKRCISIGDRCRCRFYYLTDREKLMCCWKDEEKRLISSVWKAIIFQPQRLGFLHYFYCHLNLRVFGCKIEKVEKKTVFSRFFLMKCWNQRPDLIYYIFTVFTMKILTTWHGHPLQRPRPQTPLSLQPPHGSHPWAWWWSQAALHMQKNVVIFLVSGNLFRIFHFKNDGSPLTKTSVKHLSSPTTHS